jgi:hypothetical protein
MAPPGVGGDGHIEVFAAAGTYTIGIKYKRPPDP